MKRTFFKSEFMVVLLLGSAIMLYLFSYPMTTDSKELDRASASYKIVVKKSERKLYLYNEQAKLVKTYKIALGFTPTGTKIKQGDGATPEGDIWRCLISRQSHSMQKCLAGIGWKRTASNSPLTPPRVPT